MDREFGNICGHMTKEICHMTGVMSFRLVLAGCFILGLSGDSIQESSRNFYGRLKLQRVEMEADLAGNYTSLAKFINALERDEMFFIINSVTLGGQPQGPVKLNVKLETYLKAGS